ncbi:hypothetical protein GF354_00225 [Candidatus Peregrinibacteria bacterium]|nr:hypothetical protein [Candidatus Peregrinibacteria bacterium]
MKIDEEHKLKKPDQAVDLDMPDPQVLSISEEARKNLLDISLNRSQIRLIKRLRAQFAKQLKLLRAKGQKFNKNELQGFNEILTTISPVELKRISELESPELLIISNAVDMKSKLNDSPFSLEYRDVNLIDSFSNVEDLISLDYDSSHSSKFSVPSYTVVVMDGGEKVPDSTKNESFVELFEKLRDQGFDLPNLAEYLQFLRTAFLEGRAVDFNTTSFIKGTFLRQNSFADKLVPAICRKGRKEEFELREVLKYSCIPSRGTRRVVRLGENML